MEAKIYLVTASHDHDLETYGYYIREDSMTPTEQEAAKESNLRAGASGFDKRVDAIAAAEIDAKDIRRAARARIVEV